MIGYVGQGILGILATLTALGAAYPFSLIWQKRMAVAQFLVAFGAFSLLLYAHVTSDFSLATVFRHSHTAKPLLYKISGLWGHHEGSFLLWVFILSGYNMVFVYAAKGWDPSLQKLCLTLSSAVLLIFSILLLGVCDPFTLLSIAPSQGLDLNPLLQDPALAVHPPFLYLGYVGFVVPFVLSLSLLVRGSPSDLEAIFPFWYRVTIVPWLFLTIGLGLGSFWAYYELGWGGWWAWDPVENVALMPWLSALILLHTLHMVKGQKAFIKSALFLSLLPFWLALGGTVLVRSGVLTSVHSFAVDPQRALMLSIAVGFLFVSGLIIFLSRHSFFSSPHTVSLQNRSGYLGLGIISVGCSLGCVIVGTIYPLGAELWGQLVCVGASYYHATFLPMMVPALILMGVSPFFSWTTPSVFKSLHFTSLCLTLAFVVAWNFLAPFHALSQLFFTTLGIWVAISSFVLFIGEGCKRIPLFLCHFGMGIMILGISISAYCEQEKLIAVAPTESFSLGPYTLKMDTIQSKEGPNYKAQQVVLHVYKDTYWKTTLYPEKRFYWTQKIIHGETALYHDGFSDLYVSLGEEYAHNKWSIHLFYKPGLNLLWGGIFLMVCGLGASLWRRPNSPSLLKNGTVAVLVLFLQSIIPAAYALNAHEQLSNPSLEKRARFLYKNLLCPTCGGQNLEGSPSDTAYNMRKIIRQGLTNGLSNDLIVETLQHNYGDQISLIPTLKKSTVLLWSLPWIFFSCVCAGLTWWFRRSNEE